MSPAPCLMIQGTASGVGKSTLVAALCRLFARAGYRVAPFKAQNMSLNAAVTPDGGEIGRAQAAQAEAAGLEPTVDMNPILLKPEGGERWQVVVRGAALGSVPFREYGARGPALLDVVRESLARLRRAHDLVLIEGAGSPAEINLERDLANMTVARLADAPVLLVGDIDRGGVFAALLGTVELLPPEDRARVAGFVVNRLRGASALLRPGLDALARRTGIPVLGVVPWLEDGLAAAEDALALDEAPAAPSARLEIAIVRLPHIANFDDFEPLAREPDVAVRFVRTPAAVDAADAVVLPGSKSTVADLAWLRGSRLDAAIAAVAAGGRVVLGVCGGYQMLGTAVADPEHVESPVAQARGLGLLPVTTTFATPKRTARVRACALAGAGPFAAAAGSRFAAYEIHAGRTSADGARAPFAVLERGGALVDARDGAVDAGGAVLGTSLHGLLASGPLRGALLADLARRRGIAPDPRWGASAPAPQRYDRLADAVGAALDLQRVADLVGLAWPQAVPS